jgi:hypothetical protein
MVSERKKALLAGAAGCAIGWGLSRIVLGPIIGCPGEWRRFTKANRERLKLLRDLSVLAGKALSGRRPVQTVADRVVFSMGCLCWEDFNEILVLCGNGLGIAAAKLLRSLYEHTVTCQYISKRPKEAEAFERYAHVQEHKMLSHAKATFDLKALFTDERRAGIEQEFEGVKGAYGKLSWTKKDLLTLAREEGEGLELLYLQCYFDPTVHSHATPLAFISRLLIENGDTVFVPGPQRERATAAMSLAHSVMLLALRTQNEYFKLGLDTDLWAHAQAVLHSVAQGRNRRF